MDAHRFMTSTALLLGLFGACTRTPSPPASVDEPTSAPPVLVEAERPIRRPNPSQPATTEVGTEGGEEPFVFAPVTRGQGHCEVTVAAVLEAEEYRGPGPITPAVEASLNADPGYARTYNRLSHGDHHIQCHYEVRLGHRPKHRFRWREVHGNTLRDHTAALCDDPEQVVAAAEHIIESTKQCTQLDAGAYWGYVLEQVGG